MISDAVSMNQTTAQGWAMCEPANHHTVARVTRPTAMPRLAEPSTKATLCSIDDKGGVRKSALRPIILACRIDEDELAKALFRTFIMTRPGAMNSV